MPSTLLVVDSRGHPRALIERLAALGYECVYARGPLRVRAMLSRHTVDLILWKDNTGHAGLAADYVAEWRRHPHIPVVRLYGKGAAVPDGIKPRTLAAALVANLPSETSEYQLFSALSQCLSWSAPESAARPAKELAFRHAVAALWARPVDGASTSAAPAMAETGCDTAVTQAERDLLREHTPTLDPQAGETLAPWRRAWKRLLARHFHHSAS